MSLVIKKRIKWLMTNFVFDDETPVLTKDCQVGTILLNGWLFAQNTDKAHVKLTMSIPNALKKCREK